LQALRNTGSPDEVSLSPATLVNVGLYTVPRAARQPDTTITLGTLDARFPNASTQIGDSLFNVHTINVDTFPTPRWYEIDTAGDGVLQSGIFFGTPLSDDFNASIVANDEKDVFVTWTSTKQPIREGPSYFPQIRTSGRLNTDPPNEISSGSVVFESPTFYTSPQWGNYSAITVDPSNPKCAWGVNQTVIPPVPPSAVRTWGTGIFRTCFQIEEEEEEAEGEEDEGEEE
nr:hypothetical protein [Verrucomicrobiota bacterium]